MGMMMPCSQGAGSGGRDIMILESEQLRKLFLTMYGGRGNDVEAYVSRYRSLLGQFREYFGEGEVQLFSTPGRTEIAGNHTDHNGGVVIAASVHLDSIAAVRTTDTEIIRIFSEGYAAPFEVYLGTLEAQYSERETTTALIRGIAGRMRELGYRVGGFNAYISSNVGVGSGLSSSASIEVLVATIMNCLYNNGKIPMLELAKIGRYAENNFFMKPCGLMDQIACGFGGIVAIDFTDSENPVVRGVDVDLSEYGYSILVVRTGSDHADLTEDYANITEDMRAAAEVFDKKLLRELTIEGVMDHVSQLRREAGDRSLLRAFHFLMENERVRAQVEALQKGEIEQFLTLVQSSGNSSALWLQNSFSTRHPRRQPVTVSLALTEYFLHRVKGGAYRVHGGGFAGTIQVFLPVHCCEEYIDFMESRIGSGTVTVLHIRPYGSVHINGFLSNEVTSGTQ
jgi:galactokinase